MPTYTFFIISNAVLSFNGGTNAFDFDAGYDFSTDRFRIEVNDDDEVMNSGGDANQFASIYDMNGNLIDSGIITVPAYAELTLPGGGTGFIDRIEIDGVSYGYLPSFTLTPGTSYPVASSATFEEPHTYYENNSVPCFGPDTLIERTDGPCPVAHLQVGDLVLTYDNGPQPILWTGSRHVPAIEAVRRPQLRPVFYDTEEGRVTLSRQHRIFMQSPRIDLMGYSDGAFVAAGQAGSAQVPKTALQWHHFLLPRHEIVRANGIWVESLFIGPALNTLLTPAQSDDAISALGATQHQRMARPSLKQFEATFALSGVGPHQPKRNNRVAQGQRAA
ncbi:Hint domain-containing protein [Octadecabacter sp. G9-8]|uniref:Hint domain-containing protein n=1 Tax=Octadecabacter dasysiphoniae TaxID=2909341 RepID=A0ABS9CXC4_9RHOB|nr:Hint domain-containing protein [Octadecabacter dasysiphoniae]MCF2871035.1 Hint domain-containing protein [Octadecabacter dasysiphoniae]